MKPNRYSFLIFGILVSLLCVSCVQLNTHKNIRTAGQYYEGYQLSPPKSVYLSEGQWYIKAEKYKLKRHYSVLNIIPLKFHLTDYLETSGYSLGTVYLPIDKNIAKNLRGKNNTTRISRVVDEDPTLHKLSGGNDGSIYSPYALTMLIQGKLEGRKDYLPSSKEYPVLAAKSNRNSRTCVSAYYKDKEFKQNIAYLALSHLDFVVVDIPLSIISTSILYVTVPVAASVAYLTLQ